MAVVDLIPAALAGVCWLSRASLPRHPRRRTPHRHPEIEANLIESGSCRYLIDDHVQTLRRGDLFWLFPDQSHMIIDASDDMSLWVVLARPDFLVERAPQVPAEAAGSEAFGRPHRLREAERVHLAGVAAALARDEQVPAHHNNGLAWWFGEAARLTEAQSGRVGKALHPAIVKALSLLDADPSLPLPRLADAVHLSASRLSHLFVEQLERSVSAHRNHIKLRRFQERIGDGSSRNLTQAAFDAGFGSYAQFARVLRASTGVAPREMLGDAVETGAAEAPQLKTINAQRRAQSAQTPRRRA